MKNNTKKTTNVALQELFKKQCKNRGKKSVAMSWVLLFYSSSESDLWVAVGDGVRPTNYEQVQGSPTNYEQVQGSPTTMRDYMVYNLQIYGAKSQKQEATD